VNPTTYIDVTCCGETVHRLRMVLPHGSDTWFLALIPTFIPGGAVEAMREDVPLTGVECVDADRGRLRLACPICGLDVPARDERLRVVAEKLRERGVPSIQLSALRGILRKS
jgi:hypothetical protein